LFVFWCQLLVVLGAARAGGYVARRVGMPRVIGELLAGVALGPSLLGQISPSAFEWLFPANERQAGLLLGLAPALLGTPLVLVPFYIVLSFAFTYRALDTGVKALDLATLTDAAQSLGAGPVMTITRVILPNLRTAILGAAFLTITVVLGEYVLSSLFLYNTLPVYMADVGTTQAQGAAALALITVLFTWLLLIGVSVITRRLGGGRVATTIAGA